ncbi:MAG: cold-shock protein [Ekhidna sp.]|uniref:cold-shock protein n=1 Tax=Ekhidna sp. TaxID=2608089 RepID=UPI0032EA9479
MARSQNSFIKNQKAQKKKKKRQEKLQKKFDKKDQETSGSLDDMIAYVDEFGNIVDEPPQEPVKKNEPKQ